MYPEAFKAAAPPPAKPTAVGQVGEFFKGLVPGAVGAVESAAVGASALLPDEWEPATRRGIASLAGALKSPFAATPGYEETIGRKLGEAGGSIAPFLLTRSKPTAAGLGAGMGAGEARTRAEQEGATADQIGRATALGSVVGLSEMFAPMRILGRVDEPAKRGAVEAVKRALVAGGEEAAQEAASQVAQNLIAKGIYKPEQAIIEQVGESAAYGGAVGAMAQGLFDMALGRRAKRAGTQDEIQKAREEADAAAQAEAARKAEPGYAQQFVDDYDARKAQFVEGRKALKKPGKDETPDVWATYNEQKKELNALRDSLEKDAKEYNKLRGQVAAQRAQEAEARKPQEIADELARLRAESKGQTVLPGFEAETTTPAAEPATPEEAVDYVSQARNLENRLDELRSQAQATTSLDKKLELNRLYQQTATALEEAKKQAKAQATPDNRIANLRKKMAAAEETGDLPAQAQIAQQLKELGVTDLAAQPAGEQTSFPLFPLKPVSEGKEAFAARVYKPGAPQAEAEEAAALEERRLQDELDRREAEREKKIGPEVAALQRMRERPTGLTNIAAPFNKPTPEAPAGSAAMAMMDQRLRLEAELTTARANYYKARQNFDNTPATQQTLDMAEQAYAAAQQNYDTALADMRQQELIPTAEEDTGPEVRKFQKAPSEGFRLFPRQGAPERPSEYQDLSTRLASALARNDIDQDTYNFLRRAEKVLPTIDQSIEAARAERTERGVVRDVASTEGFLTLFDQQLAKIESNEEGVYPSRRYVEEPFRARGTAAETARGSEASGRDIGQFRTMEQASEAKLESERRARRVPAMPGEAERINLPGAPAAMRTEATTGTTLRTPAKPLSLAGELEPLLRLQEQLAGPDLAESTQGELFPSRETGVVRSSYENLVKFMQSKAVQALRAALPKTTADVAKQEKALPALKARVDELQKRLTQMEADAQAYKTAQQVLKSNKDLANTERDIQSVQKAITANVTTRINLEKQIQDLGAEIKRLEEARVAATAPTMSVAKLKQTPTKIGLGRGEVRPYMPRDVETDPVLQAQLANLEQRTTDLRNRMQELLNERNTLDGAMSQLDSYVKVIQARNKVTELQAKAPFGYELDAAKDELLAAQRAAGITEQEISKAKASATATAAQERRRQEAIARAKKVDESVQRAKEQQKRLEAMYSQEVTGQQVEADPEVQARQMAADMGAPEYTPAERVQLMNNPNKVLGGLNSDVTKLQRQITAARNTSIAARKAELAPLQGKVDALEARYKATQDAATRANLLPQIEAAADQLQAAIQRQATEPLTWKGMKKQISDLAVALNKAEDLETKLGVGRVVDKNAPERAAPTFKPSKQEQAAAARERQRLQAAGAEERISAPATSGEALTKSEIKQAAAAKPTVYTGKGVGTETANPMAKDFEALEVKPARFKLPGNIETMTYKGTSIDVLDRDLQKVLYRIANKYNQSRATTVEEKLKEGFEAARASFAGMVELAAGDPSRTEVLELNSRWLDIAKNIDVGAIRLDFNKDRPVIKPISIIKRALTPQEHASTIENRFGTEVDGASAMTGMTFAEAANYGAKRTTSPMVRQLFERLAVVFNSAPVRENSGYVYATVGTLKQNGKQIAGMYVPSADTVYVQANRTGPYTTNKVLLHELTHAATVRAMEVDPTLADRVESLRQQTLDWLATPEGKTYFRKNSMSLGRKPADIYGLTNHKEFVAELFANRDFQKMLAEIPSTKPRKSIFTRFVEALSEFFNMPAKAAQSLFAEAVALTEEILDVTKNQIYEGAVPKGGFTSEATPLVVQAPKYASHEMEAAGNALDPFVTKGKGAWAKIKANTTGLAFETQIVDRFAGFERLKKYMPELQGTQMMYYLRMYDQRMNMVSQAVATGAPNLVEKKRADGKVERVLEAKPGASIKSVVEILKDANPMVGNAEAVNRLFTGYMAAIRANNKGFESLNFGEDVTQADLDKALSVVQNNPKLKAIFDKARNEYNTYNRNLIEFVVETGAMSKKVADRLLAENDYIPFYRERGGVAELLIGNESPIRIGSIKEQPYLQQLVGGDQPILDFMTSSVQNTNLLLDMGMRNLATKNAVFELLDLNAAKIVRGKPEGADVVKFKVDGEDKYAVLATEKVKIGNKEFDTGVPADILVKGMEGIPTQMPFLFRAMAVPAQLLRKGVTLTPLYMARQLFRDSVAAPILSGANFSPVLGALRQIGSPTKDTLERRGITGGQQFSGTSEDLSKILRDIAEGKPGWMSVLGKAEAMAMEADALTRRAQYNSYIEQGLSEMEATLLALESMNFNKRGASPSIHIANALIPFFNAQIQGLNVLYKAMFGKMPFNDKLKIRQKLLQRGGMMAAASIVYALMMQDDEAYKNAEPDQKYGSWFVRVPGVDEPVRIPVPFEVGYIFKALPEALVNSMLNEHGGEEAVKAFKQIALQTIPGGSSYGVPQALRPAIEAGLGKSFYTGRDILSAREKQLLPEEQFRANTTEMAKLLGQTFGFSPILFENLVRGYTGTMGLAFLQALSVGVPPGESPEAAVKRLSEYPVIGGAFQPNDAGGIVNSVYERMNDADKVAKSYEKMLVEGRTAEANALLQRRGEQLMQAELAKEFKSNMDQLVAAERAIQASRIPPEEKRKQLDDIRKLRIAVAKEVRDVSDKMVDLNFSL